MLSYYISQQFLLTMIIASFYPDVKIEAISLKHRLPTYITPLRYDINLKIDKFRRDWDVSTFFDGEVNITFQISKEKAKKDPIILNSRYLSVDEVQLDNKNTANYVVDDELERIQVNDEIESDEQNHILTIKYEGMFSTTMRGLFFNYYGREGLSYHQTYWYIATKMAPVYARYVFPCFDEPSFKAIFQLTIAYPNTFKVALSNTDIESTTNIGNLTTTKFKETPKMSPHLVAFALFEQLDVDNSHSVSGISYKIGFRPQCKHAYKYALDISDDIVKEYEDITGISYNEATYNTITKVDQIGIPHFIQGATETWGLIFYREQMLFWDAEESPADAKQRVATELTHKLGKMWFENLKTPEWWSVLWISQAFATFYQFHVLAKLERSWQMKNQLVAEIVQIMHDDFISSSPLTLLEDSYLDRGNIFSTDPAPVTKSRFKGAAIIRMIRMFMGKDIFDKGIKKFMTTKRPNVVTLSYLWDSWKDEKELNDILPKSLSEIMKGWTETAGVPIVNVRIKDKQVELSAVGIDHPVNKSVEDSIWYIPITYTTSKNPNFSDIIPEKNNWLIKTEKVLLDEDLSSTNSWIVVNLQCSAYVRVNYDRTLWKRLEIQMRRNHKEIHVLNRMQIINDLLNLALIEQIPFSLVFQVLSYLRYEMDYFPWYTAIKGFDLLKQRVEDSEVDTINTYLRTLLANFYKGVSNGTDDMTSLTRALAYKAACGMKNRNCIKQMTQMFMAYTKRSTKLDPNLKFVMYCTGLKSTYGKKLWDVWFQEMIQTRIPSEAVIIADALGCTENINTLKRFLGKLFEKNSPLKVDNSEDAKRILSVVTNNARNGPKALMEFLDENAKLAASYPGFMRNSIITLALSIRSKNELEMMRRLAEKLEMKEYTTLFENYILFCKASVKWNQNLKNIFIKPLKARLKPKTKFRATAAASKTYYFFQLLPLFLGFFSNSFFGFLKYITLNI